MGLYIELDAVFAQGTWRIRQDITSHNLNSTCVLHVCSKKCYMQICYTQVNVCVYYMYTWLCTHTDLEWPVTRYLAQVHKWSGLTKYDNINGPTWTIYVVISGPPET